MNDIDERGWDAITAAAEAAYPGVREHHVAFSPGVHFGSSLQGASAYAGPGHWFYVSYGLTELWVKESPDPTTSGFGFELTMRVPRRADETEPPTWPFEVQSILAGYVRSGPQPLWLGDRIGMLRTVDESDTAMATMAVCVDPVLAPLTTPNGSVAFWQLVGIYPDEVELAKRTSTDAVLDALRRADALLLTDPRRRSLAAG